MLEGYLGIGKPEEKKEILVESPFNSIIFEHQSVYEGDKKKLYPFDESLQALRERGYERHPRPAEVFDFICKSLEGRLQPEQQAVADDMLNSYGEWLSLAMRQVGNKLYLYFDPENILWDGRKVHNTYSAGKNFKYALEKVYDIQSLSDYVSLKKVNRVNPELVATLWSRPYAILPDDIRLNTYIYLPSRNVVWPAGRGNFYTFNIYCYDYDNWASRGVRTVTQKRQ